MQDSTAGTLSYLRSLVKEHPVTVLAFLLPLTQLLLFWPGIVEPDALSVYDQAKLNVFDDWHPPVMGRTWQVFLALGLEGTAPFFVIQIGLFWLGLGLIANAQERIGNRWAGFGVLAIGCVPHIFGWNNLVIKDAQMTCCLIAASGMFIHSHILNYRLNAFQLACIALLIAYAILVRHNAIFAAAPLVYGFLHRPNEGMFQRKPAIMTALALALFVMSGTINQSVFKAEHAYAENSLKMFDMAGVAHFAGSPTIYGVEPRDWARAEARNCYYPALWDNYGNPVEDGGCPWIYDALAKKDLTRPWLEAIFSHPTAYFSHRIRHFDDTLRFWVSRYNWDAAAPRQTDNPNPYNIGQANIPVYHGLNKLQMLFDYTPLSRPFAWYVLAFMLVAYSLFLPNTPNRRAAWTLLASAIVSETSFLVIGVASEFRYHHFALAATGCAACLLFAIPAPHRGRTATLMAVPICVLFAISFIGHMIVFKEWKQIEWSTWIDPPQPIATQTVTP